MPLTPKQEEIARDTTRFRVVNAGRRFGKTVLAVEEMIGVAVSAPNKRIAYIAPTFQQARDIAWEQLKSRCVPITKDINESRLTITVRTKGNGTSTISLKSWDAIETLRGQSFHFLVIDEVAMMRNFWIGWQEVLRPALTDTKGACMFISTPKGFNHFYDLYNLQNTEESFKSFHATTYDNPYIDPKEIEEARKQLTEDRFHQEYMADFRKMEGLVYKDFDRTRHVFDDLTPRRPTQMVYAGVDFGFVNPTAIIKVEQDSDSHFWVTREWYQREKLMPEIIEVCRSMQAQSYYPDHAEADRIEEMSRAGLNVHEISKDIEAGISTVQTLFRQNRLHIHKNCQNLIAELETYRYPDQAPDKNPVELPVKDNDHALDALRYVLHAVSHNVVELETEALAIY